MGQWVASLLGPELAALGDWRVFLGRLAGWMLIPDKVDDDAADSKVLLGVFGTTVLAFFMAEMGDKTQIATVALAAKYPDFIAVVAGTTFGMMLTNVPAVGGEAKPQSGRAHPHEAGAWHCGGHLCCVGGAHFVQCGSSLVTDGAFKPSNTLIPQRSGFDYCYIICSSFLVSVWC